MTRARFDYFRVTLKPEHELPNERDQYGKTPFEHSRSTHKNTLLLGDLIKKMVDCGRCLHYDRRFSYENISLKVPTEEHYSIQGVCLEFSAQGLDYFNGYLDDLGISFKCWCGMLRALCFRGYQIAVTRLDYAMDGITKCGEETQISLKRVIWAIRDGEMCCKARVWSDQGDDFRRLFSYKKNRKRVNGDELEGLTVQLGSRQSDTICRFYDKKTEQIQKGKELPEGCAAWTRCEFEFKNSNAMCVFNAFIDSKDDEQFSEYMCGSALNFVRFVERTSDNVSRCATKRWWKAFLTTLQRRSSFAKSSLQSRLSSGSPEDSGNSGFPVSTRLLIPGVWSILRIGLRSPLTMRSQRGALWLKRNYSRTSGTVSATMRNRPDLNALIIYFRSQL